MVQDPPAYLATTITRLAINVAKSARSRRRPVRDELVPSRYALRGQLENRLP